MLPRALTVIYWEPVSPLESHRLLIDGIPYIHVSSPKVVSHHLWLLFSLYGKQDPEGRRLEAFVANNYIKVYKLPTKRPFGFSSLTTYVAFRENYL